MTPGEWSAALASLEASRTPAGIAPDWWATILADARWIARHHAGTAAALGWTAADLFGIRPDRGPRRGGVADRLDGARRLAFTAKVAGWAWTDGEVPRSADEYDCLLWRDDANPMPTLWEIAR